MAALTQEELLKQIADNTRIMSRNPVGAAGTGLGAATGGLTSAFTAAAGAAGASAAATALIGNSFGLLSSTLGSLKGQLDEHIGVWQSLSKTGSAFSNDVVSMGVAASSTRMSLGDFSSLVKDNSVNFAGLGVNVTRGAEAFTKLSKEMFDSGITDQLREMGYTGKEVNDVLILQAGMLRGRGLEDAQQREQAYKSAAALAEEMDLMAKLTGKSRDEQMEGMKKSAVNAQVEAKLRLMTMGKTEEEAQRIRTGYLAQENAARLRGEDQAFREIFAVGQVTSKEAATQQALLGKQGQATAQQALASAKGEYETASQFSQKARAEASDNLNSISQLNMIKIGAAAGNISKVMGDNLITNLADESGNAKIRQEAAWKNAGAEEIIAEKTRRAKEAQIGIAADGTTTGSASTKAALQVTARLADVESAIANSLVKPLNNIVGKKLNEFGDSLGIFSNRIESAGGKLVTTSEFLESKLKMPTAAEKAAAAAAPPALKKSGEAAKTWVSGVTAGQTESGVSAGVGDVAKAAAGSLSALGDLFTTTPGKVEIVNLPEAGPKHSRSGGSIDMAGTLFENWGTGTDVTLHGMEGVFRPEDIKKVVENTLSGAKSTLSELKMNKQSTPVDVPSLTKNISLDIPMPSIDMSSIEKSVSATLSKSLPPSKDAVVKPDAANSIFKVIAPDTDKLLGSISDLLKTSVKPVAKIEPAAPVAKPAAKIEPAAPVAKPAAKVEDKLRAMTVGKSEEEIHRIRTGYLAQEHTARLQGQDQAFKEVFAAGAAKSVAPIIPLDISTLIKDATPTKDNNASKEVDNILADIAKITSSMKSTINIPTSGGDAHVRYAEPDALDSLPNQQMAKMGLDPAELTMFDDMSILSKKQVAEKLELMKAEAAASQASHTSSIAALDALELKAEFEERALTESEELQKKKIYIESQASRDQMLTAEAAVKVLGRVQQDKLTREKFSLAESVKASDDAATIIESKNEKIKADIVDALPVKEMEETSSKLKTELINDQEKTLDSAKTSLDIKATLLKDHLVMEKIQEESVRHNEAKIAEIHQEANGKALTVDQQSRLQMYQASLAYGAQELNMIREDIADYNALDILKAENEIKTKKETATIVEKANEKIKVDIADALVFDEFSGVDAAVAKNSTYDEFSGVDTAVAKNKKVDAEASAELARESRKGSAMQSVVTGSSPVRPQITMDSFTIGPNGMPIPKTKPPAISTVVPDNKKKEADKEAAKKESDKNQTGNTATGKDSKAGESAKKPVDGKEATLSDLQKELSKLNSNVAKLISVNEDLGNKQISAIKKNSDTVYG